MSNEFDFEHKVEVREEPNGDVTYRIVFKLPEEWTDEQRQVFLTEYAKEVKREFKRRMDKALDDLEEELLFGPGRFVRYDGQ